MYSFFAVNTRSRASPRTGAPAAGRLGGKARRLVAAVIAASEGLLFGPKHRAMKHVEPATRMRVAGPAKLLGDGRLRRLGFGYAAATHVAGDDEHERVIDDQNQNYNNQQCVIPGLCKSHRTHGARRPSRRKRRRDRVAASAGSRRSHTGASRKCARRPSDEAWRQSGYVLAGNTCA